MPHELQSIPSPGSPGYMPQLDGLRALAVLCVLPAHFLSKPDQGWLATVDSGNVGVKLFFVLSGYLITGILIRSRRQIGHGQRTAVTVLRSFYIRRFLRLMPPYYGYLVLGMATYAGARTYWLWYATYTQNILFALDPTVFSLYMAHLWTLAVEEQFYLVAPWLLLAVPTGRLTMVAWGMVGTGLAVSLGGLALGFGAFAPRMMMPTQMVTLGLGALLAVARANAPGGRLAAFLSGPGLWFGLPLFCALGVGRGFGVIDKHLAEALGDFGLGLTCAWLVAGAATGFRGPAGTVLQAAPLRYVGRISYGIYLYHFNVPGALREVVLPRLGWTMTLDPLSAFLLYAVISVAIAAASWELFERRINRLKEHFSY